VWDLSLACALTVSVSQVQHLCLKLALYVRTDKVEMCDDPFSQAAVFRPEWEHEFSQVHCHSAHFQFWLTLSAISFSVVSLSVVSSRTARTHAPCLWVYVHARRQATSKRQQCGRSLGDDFFFV
jgi:hypothetical protein